MENNSVQQSSNKQSVQSEFESKHSENIIPVVSAQTDAADVNNNPLHYANSSRSQQF